MLETIENKCCMCGTSLSLMKVNKRLYCEVCLLQNTAKLQAFFSMLILKWNKLSLREIKMSIIKISSNFPALDFQLLEGLSKDQLLHEVYVNMSENNNVQNFLINSKMGRT